MDHPFPATDSMELIQRARRGDREAIERLVAHYYGRVRPIVRARLGRALRRRVDSADILQETFVDAVGMIERFEGDGGASLLAWLTRIAELRVRAALQRASAAKRDVAREVRLGSDCLRARGLEPVDRTTPSGVVARGEGEALVLCALEELTDEQREAILLRDYAESSWTEIARVLGKPTAGAARMLHARAMAKLTTVCRRLARDD